MCLEVAFMNIIIFVYTNYKRSEIFAIQSKFQKLYKKTIFDIFLECNKFPLLDERVQLYQNEILSYQNRHIPQL